MPETAVVVSQSGAVTAGLRGAVSASGYEVAETVVTDRPEDNTYYLAPSTVAELEELCAGLDTATPYLVVDGIVHPGQMVDLRTRLESVTLRDSRGAVLEHLGSDNPAAATRFELWQNRIASRRAARTQREEAASGPSGTSGRLADHERREQQLRKTLERQQRNARSRIEDAYADVDGYVVLLARDGAPATSLWAALTDAEASEAVGRPSQVVTDTITVGPHTVAVSDTPAVVTRAGLPEWFTEGVPGVGAALERADLVMCLGPERDGLATALSERFDGEHATVGGPDADTARGLVADALGTAEYAVRLPYDDDAQALLSKLHETAIVTDVAYEESILARLTVSRSSMDTLVRRVEDVNGAVKPLDSRE